MSLVNPTQPVQQPRKARFSTDALALALAAVLSGLLASLIASPAGTPLRLWLVGVFAISSQQATWFVTRAAGILTYLLLWLSTVWGLAIPSKIFGDVLSGDFTYDFHQFISLLSLGFLGLHIGVLTIDQYLPYSLSQILVPFLSPYRPLWVGIGTIAFYLTLLVTITFYLRKRIGMKAFRVIHYASLAAYLGGAVHGLYSGADSSLPAMMVLYAVTFLAVVFLTVYWLASLWLNRRSKG